MISRVLRDVTQRVSVEFEVQVVTIIVCSSLLSTLSGMSHSVPTSPAVSRSSKIYPLTPQRPTYHQQRSLSLYRSPVTPLNSPYTPTSLRSVNSNGSSTLTTPDNSGYSTRKRLTFAGSPEVIRDGNTSKDKSLADIAKNWRSRTGSGQNKASYADHDDSGYVLDDCKSIYAH